MSAYSDRAGLVLVICAPSGTGKSTLTRRLLADHPRFTFSVSHTTRAPRPGEVDGKDYRFTDPETFKRRAAEGFFAEWAEVHGNFYGTPLQATREILADGRDILFDIDVQGAKQLKDNLGLGRYVFLFPPTMQELERRLRGRGADAEDAIRRRLTNARAEMAEATFFDTWIVNDDLDRAYADLVCAYKAETLSPDCRPGFLESMLVDWEGCGPA